MYSRRPTSPLLTVGKPSAAVNGQMVTAIVPDLITAQEAAVLYLQGLKTSPTTLVAFYIGNAGGCPVETRFSVTNFASNLYALEPCRTRVTPTHAR
jgi:hypothetical protein